MCNIHYFNISSHTGECVVCVVQTLLKCTKFNQVAYAPWQLYRVLQKSSKRFSKLLNGKQQDAHEFLKLLSEGMTNEKHSGLSFENKFNTEIITEVQCLTCKTVYKGNGTIGEFIVDIRGKKSIEIALQSYFEYTFVEYKCITCKKEHLARKRTMLLRVPAYLCITLNRFTSTNTKFKGRIQITPNLNLTKYYCESQTSQWKYKLVAMINHHGSNFHRGHYTTLAFTDDGCYKFDDSDVIHVNGNEVEGSEAYILFYQYYEVILFNLLNSI